MKKILLLFVLITTSLQAQRSVRIGYIDMEYILQNAPNYTDAKNQLEQKAQKWKLEIDTKKTEIVKLQELLLSEKVLLTKELIEEREAEIKLLETTLAEFQEKKFGPLGELIVQKTMLVQPIQDQVFNIIQDIVEAKKYDIIFDKASDLTILFASKRLDISDLVLRKLNVAIKGEQRTKKQQKEDEEKEKLQEQMDENPQLAEKAKADAKTKEARQKLLDDKKTVADLRRKEAEERRQKALDERNAKKTGTISVSDKTNDNNSSNESVTDKVQVAEDARVTRAKVAEDARLAKVKLAEENRLAREKALEERRKTAEENRLKILADREAARLAKDADKSKK